MRALPGDRIASRVENFPTTHGTTRGSVTRGDARHNPALQHPPCAVRLQSWRLDSEHAAAALGDVASAQMIDDRTMHDLGGDCQECAARRGKSGCVVVAEKKPATFATGFSLHQPKFTPTPAELSPPPPIAIPARTEAEGPIKWLYPIPNAL